MDTVDRKTRSRIMAAVKSSGNRSTEKRLRYTLVRARIKGWKMQVGELIGKPDFVFYKERLVIFVDGCFWHGCPRCYRRPSSFKKYWDNKVQKNISHDKKVRAKLRRDGWSVIHFWEHDLINSDKVVKRVLGSLQKHK
jgi:DNA mismatch endonuclease (patch repair protein)